jgi:predicted RNase H-like HicB family nuclease
MVEIVTARKTFAVVYERDDNRSWFVHCPGVKGAHSHGRTLASARENIREAIAIVLDLEEDAVFGLSEEIKLRHPGLQQAIDLAASQRTEALHAQQLAAKATTEAITESMSSGDVLSNRDLAELLGLSHQRVQQLVATLTSDG